MEAPEDGKPHANSESTLMNTSLDPHHILQDGPASNAVTNPSDLGIEPQDMRKSKSRGENSAGGRKKSYSLSSRTTDISSNTQAEQRPEHRDVRTLPRQFDSIPIVAPLLTPEKLG